MLALVQLVENVESMPTMRAHPVRQVFAIGGPELYSAERPQEAHLPAELAGQTTHQVSSLAQLIAVSVQIRGATSVRERCRGQNSLWLDIGDYFVWSVGGDSQLALVGPAPLLPRNEFQSSLSEAPAMSAYALNELIRLESETVLVALAGA